MSTPPTQFYTDILQQQERRNSQSDSEICRHTAHIDDVEFRADKKITLKDLVLRIFNEKQKVESHHFDLLAAILNNDNESIKQKIYLHLRQLQLGSDREYIKLVFLKDLKKLINDNLEEKNIIFTKNILSFIADLITTIPNSIEKKATRDNTGYFIRFATDCTISEKIEHPIIRTEIQTSNNSKSIILFADNSTIAQKVEQLRQTAIFTEYNDEERENLFSNLEIQANDFFRSVYEPTTGVNPDILEREQKSLSEFLNEFSEYIRFNLGTQKDHNDLRIELDLKIVELNKNFADLNKIIEDEMLKMHESHEKVEVAVHKQTPFKRKSQSRSSVSEQSLPSSFRPTSDPDVSSEEEKEQHSSRLTTQTITDSDSGYRTRRNSVDQQHNTHHSKVDDFMENIKDCLAEEFNIATVYDNGNNLLHNFITIFDANNKNECIDIIKDAVAKNIDIFAKNKNDLTPFEMLNRDGKILTDIFFEPEIISKLVKHQKKSVLAISDEQKNDIDEKDALLQKILLCKDNDNVTVLDHLALTARLSLTNLTKLQKQCQLIDDSFKELEAHLENKIEKSPSRKISSDLIKLKLVKSKLKASIETSQQMAIIEELPIAKESCWSFFSRAKTPKLLDALKSKLQTQLKAPTTVNVYKQEIDSNEVLFLHSAIRNYKVSEIKDFSTKCTNDPAFRATNARYLTTVNSKKQCSLQLLTTPVIKNREAHAELVKKISSIDMQPWFKEVLKYIEAKRNKYKENTTDHKVLTKKMQAIEQAITDITNAHTSLIDIRQRLITLKDDAKISAKRGFFKSTTQKKIENIIDYVSDSEALQQLVTIKMPARV